jgi:aspartate aminotransferase-like enzyme
MGQSLTLDEIEQAIISSKPQVLYLVHGESSSGVRQPIEGVGELCQKYAFQDFLKKKYQTRLFIAHLF